MSGRSKTTASTGWMKILPAASARGSLTPWRQSPKSFILRRSAIENEAQQKKGGLFDRTPPHAGCIPPALLDDRSRSHQPRRPLELSPPQGSNLPDDLLRLASLPGAPGLSCRGQPLSVRSDPPGLFPESHGRPLCRRRLLGRLVWGRALYFPPPRGGERFTLFPPEPICLWGRFLPRLSGLSSLPDPRRLQGRNPVADRYRRRRCGIISDLFLALLEVGLL